MTWASDLMFFIRNFIYAVSQDPGTSRPTIKIHETSTSTDLLRCFMVLIKGLTPFGHLP